MRDHNISLGDMFGHDPELLSAALHDDWFTENTEPHPDKHYTPSRKVQDDHDPAYPPGLNSNRKTEPNLCAFRHYGININCSAGDVCSFLHADETESNSPWRAVATAFEIETDTVIPHCEK